MIRGNDNNQVQLFNTPFEQELDLENRWVKFSNIIPWNKLSSFYYTRMSSGMGASTTDARVVLGAIIIKHHENLSDVGTIEAIQENIYMQCLLGLPSFHNGLTYLDNLSWDSYNETEDLKTSANNYKKRNGYFPAKINADQIYITRDNRARCKDNNIQLNGKPLGRPTEQTKERIKELRQAVSERNCVEGKFGQAKRWYGMGNTRAKLKTTSESMIGAIVVVLNPIRLVQQHVFTFIKNRLFKIKITLLNLFYPKIIIGLFE